MKLGTWHASSLVTKALALVVAGVASSISVGQELQGPARAIPATYFGMHFHRLDSGTKWPVGTGIGSWRLWDAYVIWPNIEPERGRRDFSRLDRYVGMASILKIDLVVPLGMSPRWASARPDEKGPYGLGSAAEPRDMADWDNYVRALAERYKGRVGLYELWNEVNAGTGFYSGSLEKLLELQRRSYQIIKQVDERALFISPSTVGAWPNHWNWFEQFLAAGGGEMADVIAYHFYQPRDKPEALLGLVERIRQLMVKHRVGHKPLWNTESGYRFDIGQGDLAQAADRTWPKLDEETAAAYVMRALVLGWLAGLERFYWYAWDSKELGFIRPDGTPTLAAEAYAVIARWLTGARLESCTRGAGMWRCRLRRGEELSLLIWHESSTATLRVPTIDKGPSCVERRGRATERHAANDDVTVGPEPIRVSRCAAQ